MVDCSEFLEGYSDFRDGLLDAARTESWRAHLAACGSCRRYDRVVRSGTEVVRGLPTLEPSHDFLARLQHRIFHIEEERHSFGRDSSSVSVPLIALIAGVIGASAWFPLMRREPAVVTLPPVVAHAPYRPEAAPQLFRPGPFLSPAPPSLSPAVPAMHTLFFPYSPIGSQVANPGRARLGN